MTVGEVKNMFKDQYADVEYYKSTFNCTHQIDFNLEHCTGVDACEVNDDMEAVSYQLADEDTYNKTVLANSEIAADLRIGMATILQKYCAFYCKTTGGNYA